ncbi:hypothetical protein B0H10DRAFT_1687771, partial [Mycena sp. CBHHK59/15]
RIHHCVRHFLAAKLDLRPTLDFGRLFFTVAIKEGSSERIHIDWNDDIHKYTLIFCAGDFTGTEFCTLQLDICIPLRPGSVLVMRTWVLAHCSTLVGQG